VTKARLLVGTKAAACETKTNKVKMLFFIMVMSCSVFCEEAHYFAEDIFRHVLMK